MPFALNTHPRRVEIADLADAIQRGPNAPLTRVGAIAEALNQLGLDTERSELNAELVELDAEVAREQAWERAAS
jgi:hypothetical protein